MRDLQNQSLETIRRQFASGSRSVAFSAPTGSGTSVVIARHIAERAARGQRCLVLHPVPRIRLDMLVSDAPEVKSGRLDSGAAVEVASYVAAERRLIVQAAPVDFDLIVMEELRDCDKDRAETLRKAFPRADCLLVGYVEPAVNDAFSYSPFIQFCLNDPADAAYPGAASPKP